MNKDIELKGFHSYMTMADDSFVAVSLKDDNDFNSGSSMELFVYTPSQYIDGDERNEDFEKLVNRSIQETFSRTLFTSITTLIPVIALTFLGSREIFTFNMAMLIGLVAGTYSSIFVSMATFMALEKRNIGKPKKKKKIYTDEFEEKKIKGINC